MNLEVIETDNGGHFYQVDGRRMPGVSEILDDSGVILANAFYEERRAAAAVRGRDVHLACADLDLGRPDWWSDDEEIAPYVRAYQLFKNDFSFRPTSIEKPMFHPNYRYCGTPDRFGQVRHRDGIHNVTLDLKCVAVVGPHVPLQLAGYNQFTEDHFERDLIALQLLKNGKYRIHNYPDRDHQTAIFLAMLTVFNWKQRYLKSGETT